MGYRKPVILDSSDPRNDNANKYRSKLGRELIVKNLGKPEGLEITEYKEPGQYWVSLYTFNQVSHQGRASIVDKNGNVYLAGRASSNRALLIKYDENRNLLWQRAISSNSIIFDIDLDDLGNIYVVGNYLSGTKYNTFLIKYNKNGSLIFQRKLNTQFDNIQSFYPNVKVDSTGNIYITSSYSNAGIFEGLLVKYNDSGTIIWKKNIYNPITCYQPVITLDSNNNIIMCIAQKVSVDINRQRFTFLKINSSGSIVNQKSYIDPGNFGLGSTTSYIPLKIKCDKNNNVYASMLTYANVVGDDHIQRPLLIKLDSSFTSLWQKYPNNGLTSWQSWADGLDIDLEGNVYWGVYESLDTARIYKLSEDGTLIFTRRVLFTGSFSSVNDTSVYSINIKNNYMHIIGSTYSSTNNTIAYALKIDMDGLLTGTYTITNFITLVYEVSSISLLNKGYLVSINNLSIKDSNITESDDSLISESLSNAETGIYLIGDPPQETPPKISPETQIVVGETEASLTTSAMTTNYRFLGTTSYSVYGEENLPSGLSINTSNGQISGTPSLPLSENNFTITGVDNFGTSATANLNLTVLIKAAISPLTQTINGTMNIPITPTIAFTPNARFVGPITYSISGGTLPAGLTLNTSTGVISGTPTEGIDQTEFTITASGVDILSQNVSATATIDIFVLGIAEIAPAYQTIVTLKDILMTPTTAFTANAVFIAPVTYTLIPPPGKSLPSGLSFDTSTGIISGTPTTTLGTTEFTVQADDTFGNTATAIISLNVTATSLVVGPETINSPSLTDAASVTNIALLSTTASDTIYDASVTDSASTLELSSLTASVADTISSFTITDSALADLIGSLSSGVSENITMGSVTDNQPILQLL